MTLDDNNRTGRRKSSPPIVCFDVFMKYFYTFFISKKKEINSIYTSDNADQIP